MDILIDTNFAITCVRQKIDFVDLAGQLVSEPIEWIIPENVLDEIVKISSRRGEEVKDKQAAVIFMEMIKKINFKKIRFKIENVDDAIVNFCLKNPSVVLATLDKELNSRVKNKVLTIKGKKFLQFV